MKQIKLNLKAWIRKKEYDEESRGETQHKCIHLTRKRGGKKPEQAERAWGKICVFARIEDHLISKNYECSS